MNPIKVNSTNKNIIFERQNGKDSAFSAKFGDIIKATVVGLNSPKATLYVDENFSFEADVKTLRGQVNVGDEISFEVIKADKNSFTFKQLSANIQKQNVKTRSADEMKELFKQQGMYQDDFKTAEDEAAQNQKKAADAVSKIRRKVDNLSGNATREAINELIAAGLSIEKITIDMLNTAMRETEAQIRETDGIGGGAKQSKPPARKKAHSQNDTGANSASDTKHKASEANDTADDTPYKTNAASDTPDTEYAESVSYENLFKLHGIAENPQNTAKLEAVASKWEEVKRFNDEAIISLLRTGSKLTLENIYKAKYSILAQVGKTKTEVEGLDAEISKFLRREGFGENAENMRLSKLLVASDIPLDAENFNKASFLRGISDYGIEKILNMACENIKNGKRASDIEMFSAQQKEAFASLVGEYNNTIKALPKVTVNVVELALRSKGELTLRSLTAINPLGVLPNTVSDEAISAKRRLIEIQHKLTSEAALRLANKSININIMPISEALETLRELERQEYEKNFRVMGVKASPDNMGEITDLFDKVRDIKPPATGVFGDIIQRRVPFSINGVFESAKAAEGYEKSETQIMPKFGDSFSKVETQFEQLLTSLEITPTEENIRAASILSKSGLDVTEENILKVKNIDTKIEAVYDRLHPYIAVDMIKNNKNPVNMHIDELLEYIEGFDGMYGVGVKDKIANYIMEMDNSGVLSDITREAMVSVYRMLSQIQKDGAASLGVSIKKDSDITLASLFNDAKYFQRTKGRRTDIDTRIGENTNTKVRSAGRNTENAVSEALNENNMGPTQNNLALAKQALETLESQDTNKTLLSNERARLLADEIALKANYKTLGELIEQNPQYMNMPLDELAKLLSENGNADTNFINARYAQIINDLKEVPPQVIMWLESAGIPLTAANINAANNLLSKPRFISENLNETREENTETFEAITDLADGITENTLAQALPALEEALNNFYTEGELPLPRGAAQRIDTLRNAVRLQNLIQQREDNNYYQIPVKLHDKIGSVNMYVVNEASENAENIKMYMSLDTSKLGEVSIFINVSGNTADLKVTANNNVSLRLLSEAKGELTEFVEAAGFKLNKVTFETRGEVNIFENETEKVLPFAKGEANMLSAFEFAV
ncbi:MAG: DUF6240 domain-containing protein [Clostridiales bacterium]|nr:DUF6240 domain-containing protein [Clostridiales bacterium]